MPFRPGYAGSSSVTMNQIADFPIDCFDDVNTFPAHQQTHRRLHRSDKRYSRNCMGCFFYIFYNKGDLYMPRQGRLSE